MKRSTDCPVLPLAYEYDRLTRAYHNIDVGTFQPKCEELEQQIIWSRLDAISSEISYLKPASADGAAFQIMLANSLLEVIKAGKGKPARRNAAAHVKRLLYAAVNHMATGDERIADATQFLMGSHIDPADMLSDIERRQ